MQSELDTTVTARPAHILGVNGAGLESGNAAMCAGRTLPWLQDTASANVWGLWAVNYRDVVILDQNNLVVGVYSLTTHDLSNPANYADLKNILLTAAR
jgi:hypothetical protein